MGYQVSWLLENRIMLIKYDGVLTKEMLHDYLAESMDLRDKANAVLGEGGPLIHTITDARGMTKVDLPPSEAMKQINYVRKQRVGWTIYIPAGKLDNLFASIGHQIAGVRFRSFPNLTESIKFLKEVDNTLPEFSYTENTLELRPVDHA